MDDVTNERLDALNGAMDVLDLFTQGKVHVGQGRMPAVVFDIDDTLIDSTTRSSIIPMVLVYRKIQKMNIPIFIITARSNVFLKETHTELRQHRITGYQNLYMVGHDLRTTPGSFIEDKNMRKAKARQQVESQGYDILLNIGDDPGDMMHGHYMYGIKLPYLY